MKKSLNPKYWPALAGYGLFRILLFLPYPILMGLGRATGLLIYYVAPERRAIARINIARCFPKLSDKAQATLVRQSFYALGMSVFETGLSFWASDRKLKKRLSIEGIEHYKAALASGRGILLISGHFTTLELASRMGFSDSFGFNQSGAPISMIYRPNNNPLIEGFIQKGRARYFKNMFAKNNVKGMMAALKRGELVCYTPDQSFKRNTVFVPFFNITTATTTATSRILKATNAVALPCFCVRKKGHYTIKFSPVLDTVPSDDLTADITQVSAAVERAVRDAPDQYLWAHRRFKLRPPGEPAFYDKKLLRRRKS